jgi:hypothetical protein
MVAATPLAVKQSYKCWHAWFAQDARTGRYSAGMTNYTDTYLYEHRAWKCLQAHLTPLAPEHWPNDSTIVSAYIKGKRQARP